MATTENTETQNTVRELLQDNFPDVDLEAGALVGSGALDSMASIQLVSLLEDEFDISLSPLDMVPEDFASVAAIAALVDRLMEE